MTSSTVIGREFFLLMAMMESRILRYWNERRLRARNHITLRRLA